jgi:hypothetical protein
VTSLNRKLQVSSSVESARHERDYRARSSGVSKALTKGFRSSNNSEIIATRCFSQVESCSRLPLPHLSYPLLGPASRQQFSLSVHRVITQSPLQQVRIHKFKKHSIKSLRFTSHTNPVAQRTIQSDIYTAHNLFRYTSACQQDLLLPFDNSKIRFSFPWYTEWRRWLLSQIWRQKLGTGFLSTLTGGTQGEEPQRWTFVPIRFVPEGFSRRQGRHTSHLGQ